MRFVSSSLLNVSNHFNTYIACLKNFDIPSFAYWIKSWDNLFHEHIFNKTLELKNSYHWDFNYHQIVDLRHLRADLLNQRMFFMLGGSTGDVNGINICFNSLSRRHLKGLSSKAYSLLKSFEKDQLFFKNFLEKQAQLAAQSKDIPQEDTTTQESQRSKQFKKGQRKNR